jgi:hypothetical protein
MMSALDLSCLSGLVTLTSSSLLSSRSRTLLVHIKAMPETNAKNSVSTLNIYFIFALRTYLALGTLLHLFLLFFFFLVF